MITVYKCGKAYWENGVYIGDIIQKEDGYYDYWPNDKPGFMSSHYLRAIADKLDAMNAEWDKEVKEALSGK